VAAPRARRPGPLTRRKLYIERTFRGTKREASKALAALIVEAERLTPRSAKKGTVETLFNEWLEHATPSFSPKTVSITRMYIDNSIVPGIGSIPVTKLTPADLDRFYRQLLRLGAGHGPYAPATIRRVHGIIRRALAQGVRWGWVTHNAAIDASPPRVSTKELAPPSPDELVRLFRTAEETDPSLAAFILLAASTGARRGELIELRWKDADLARQTLSIERGIVLADGELIEQGTKTHQGRRVTLDTATNEVLAEHKRRSETTASAAGALLIPESFVFSHAADGSTPWRPDSTTRAFRAQ
jgi:integrase